ncbi:MAG TPA: twin-arginine translocation signal domain-containing protein [Ramlibacter sp.]|nr:twin-arginine translocation signal domain-containing protein [Ramlibacter sp.]
MESQTKPSRRGFLWGAAATGAAATAAVTLPQVQQQGEPPASQPQPAPERGGGYRLSEHVKQYYKTTLV